MHGTLHFLHVLEEAHVLGACILMVLFLIALAWDMAKYGFKGE